MATNLTPHPIIILRRECAEDTGRGLVLRDGVDLASATLATIPPIGDARPGLGLRGPGGINPGGTRAHVSITRGGDGWLLHDSRGVWSLPLRSPPHPRSRDPLRGG